MYISSDWLGPLEDALLKTERKHSGSIRMLSDIFNYPHELVYRYGDNERVFGQHSWYSGNSDGRIHKRGKKRPNPWEFYDMHGNVWEWYYDRDDDFAHRLIIDFKQEEGDKVEVRAIRGGGCSSLVYACRIANRNWYPLHENSNCIGFRVALVRKQPGLKKGSYCLGGSF